MGEHHEGACETFASPPFFILSPWDDIGCLDVAVLLSLTPPGGSAPPPPPPATPQAARKMHGAKNMVGTLLPQISALLEEKHGELLLHCARFFSSAAQSGLQKK